MAVAGTAATAGLCDAPSPNPARITWLDTHCHVCSTTANGDERPGFARHLLNVLDNDPNDLRMVICPDSHWMGWIRRDPDGMRAAAKGTRAVAGLAPGRLYGALMPNPHFPDDSLRLMDECFGKWGFVMMGEMMQYTMGYRLVDPDCLRLLRHAAQLRVPVMSHVATFDVKQNQMTGTGQLLDLCEAAVRVPEVRLIAGHFVGMAESGPTWVEHYLDVIDKRFGCWPRNLWAEIRDFGSPGLKPALERIPLDRLVSGTDWTTRGTPPLRPYATLFDCMLNGVPEPYDEPASTWQFIHFLQQAGLTPPQVRAIAYENAAALLRLDGAGDPGPLHPNAAELARPVNVAALDWDPDQARSLYVIRVPVGTTEPQLVRRLRAHGVPAESAKIARDCHTGRTWGYAIVQMPDAASARQALTLSAETKRKLKTYPVYLTRR